MTASGVRRGLHASHAVSTILLLGTGLLLEFPELRAVTLGGYGRRIVQLHLAAGALFALTPLAALALAGRPLLADLRRRLGPPDPWRWRKCHITGSLLAALVLAASGFLLWGDAGLPISLADASRAAHLVFGAAIALTLPVHLVVVRRKLRARGAELLGIAKAPGAYLDPDAD